MALIEQNKTPKEGAVIWDFPLRFFHWAMVGVVAIAALTGYLFEGWWLNIHVYAGYALLCLLLFRLVWGFVGSYYSRFHHFPLARQEVVAHIKSLLKGRSKEYVGHNPVGAWMIVILLSTLVLLVLSGLLVWGGQENSGPLASVASYGVGKASEEVHEVLAGLLMAAIAFHIGGVLIENFIFKHPLIKAMMTGRKEGAIAQGKVRVAHSVLGIGLFFAIACGVAFWVNAAQGPRFIGAQNATYTQECGDCHLAYHPSMRTGESWEKMLLGLESHYGEDASLIPEKRAEILAYLQENNATTFDTKVAHKIGQVETASLRMTDTRYWQKKHDDFKPATFTHAEIGSKVNCNACHQDAADGRFSESAIKLPKGIKK
jgi:cytochrome b